MSDATDYEIQTSDGVLIDRERVAAVIAALQADCERWSAMYARKADELLAAKAELAMWKPMTMEEAEAALEEVISEPISDERIEAIVSKVTDPAYRPSEPEHVLLAGKVMQLKVELTTLTARLAEVEGERDNAIGTGLAVIRSAERRAEAAETRLKELEGEMEAHRRTYGSNLNLPRP